MGKEVTISILSKLMNRSKQEIRETVNKLKEKNVWLGFIQNVHE
ncbi:hypothetical protein [Shouchella lehensis]|nr:hypothetical protein [Shouchella lehensis]